MTVFVDSRDPKKTQDAVLNANKPPACQTERPSVEHALPENSSSVTRQQSGGEEPEMVLEPDLPSDGRDVVGEAMIRDLP